MILDFIKRSAEKSGFKRESYVDNNVPTAHSNISILPFFGDLESFCILSSYLFKRFKDEIKHNKYLILCSWPGLKGLCPYVDEYWAINETEFCQKANGFNNSSEMATICRRNLNLHFEDIIEHKDINLYYNFGFTDVFWNRFKQIARYLPSVPSPNIVNNKISQIEGKKVLLSPFVNIKGWKNGFTDYIKTPKQFWIELVNFLSKNGITPIVWQNIFSHNISTEVVNSAYVFAENDISAVMAIQRNIGCTLDVFQGLSRLSILARSPYISCEERSRFFYEKIYEIDDLGPNNLPHDYIFSFANIIEAGGWENTLFKIILSHLEKFSSNRDGWPSTAESYVLVSYDKVRERKLSKLGANFIKMPLND